MTNAEVLARLLAILSDVAGLDRTPADVDTGTPLRDGGFWLDSVALLELILAVEEEFEVDFEPVTDFGADTLHTVGSLAAVIGKRLATP